MSRWFVNACWWVFLVCAALIVLHSLAVIGDEMIQTIRSMTANA